MRSFLLVSIVFVASTLFSLYGFKLRSQFHCADECDMTYSRYRFVDIDIAQKTRDFNYNYKLYKFTDRLDLRHSHLWRDHMKTNNIQNEDPETPRWCQSYGTSAAVGHPVLYIPGHYGSHLQSRSLGAHGIQISKGSYPKSHKNAIVQSLTDGTFNAFSNTIDNFLYDVYSVDFGGEGSAFHASKLMAQAKFIAKSIVIIAEGCGRNIEDITIVGHSIGGLAARMAIVLLNERSLNLKSAQNVITLATPHITMPFNFDNSIIAFYDELKREERALRAVNGRDTVNIISISGGLRDEIIPPRLCGAGDEDGRNGNIHITTSILASDVMPGLGLGMDHKAIVWCHNILSIVRDLIHVTVISSNSTTSETMDEIQKYVIKKMDDKVMSCVNNDLNATGCENDRYAYEYRVRLQEQKLQDEYGIWGSQAILTTMLYNAQQVVFLYVVNSIIHNIFILRNSQESYYFDIVKCYFIIPPVSTSIILILNRSGALFHQSNTMNMVVIAFLAMNVYYTLLYGLAPILSFIVKKVTTCYLNWSTHPKFSKECKGSKCGHHILLKLFVSVIRDFLLTGAVYAILGRLLISASLVHAKDLTTNLTSILSHLFLILVLLICLKIVYLGCSPASMALNSKEEHREYNLKQRRMVAALIVIIFPVLVVGKVIYASSLLTTGGQSKAAPFIEFESSRWARYYGTSYTVLEVIWKRDLARFTISVCIPVYLLLCAVDILT